MEIDEIWRRLERWAADHVPGLEFAKGATDSEIAAVEKTLGISFPEDFRQSLAIHNGEQYEFVREGFNPGGRLLRVRHGAWLPGGANLHSLGEIETQWTELLDYVDNQFEQEFSEDGKTREVIFHRKRIPIAEQEGITWMFLDFCPGPKGTDGQVIYNINECDFKVLGTSFTAFLSRHLHLLETGKLVFSEKYNAVMRRAKEIREEDLYRMEP